MMTEESGTCQHNSFVIEAPNVYKKRRFGIKIFVCYKENTYLCTSYFVQER